MDDASQDARRPAMRPTMRRLEMLGVLSVVGMLSYLTWAVGVTRRSQVCASQLKQIGLGVMQYVRDYDEEMPRRAHWPALINPYVKMREDFFDCPSPAASYAFHARLSGISLSRVDEPARLPLVFDSTLNTPGAWDNGASWPTLGVHRQAVLGQDGASTLFFDGHVAWSRQKPLFNVPIAPR